MNEKSELALKVLTLAVLASKGIKIARLSGNRNFDEKVALVKLEGVDTAERARMFTNIEVYFPVKHAEEAGPGELSWDFFVGFRKKRLW